jgi:hypothetical protein
VHFLSTATGEQQLRLPTDGSPIVGRLCLPATRCSSPPRAGGCSLSGPIEPGPMKPVIALVGRANVGKSTLFNRITKSRDAIVADFAGLTRDRHYGDARLGQREFIVVDTGGFEPDKSPPASWPEMAARRARRWPRPMR